MIDFDSINSAIMGAFAQPVSIEGGITLSAIVDLRSGGRDMGQGMLIDRVEPSITVQTADIADLVLNNGMVVTIGAADYRIMAVLPDDNGITQINLRPVL